MNYVVDFFTQTKVYCDIENILYFLAFDTPTGMPYGTVNLRYGVPRNETPVTCTAGVGTFIVEFGALSRLTGDSVFERAAKRAMTALWDAKSDIGLVWCS